MRTNNNHKVNVDDYEPSALEKELSAERILIETKSLHNFKLGLRKFLVKHKAGPMTIDDYKVPADPLAVRAFKDGQNSMALLLDPYIKGI